jgi:hypothetical protein
MDKFLGKDFYAVWIHGKRDNIRGNIPESPHYQVYDRIVNKNYPGVYYGEEVGLNDPLVYRLATEALTEASLHENFCCFVQFGNPDNAGHRYEDYNKYLEYAFRVDEAIYDLMQLLPDDTDIIYCSDHGFNFKSLGEIENSHMFAPKGMLTTNFPTLQTPYVCQHSIGRLIYTRSGGDPNHVDLASGTYSMYGTDLTDDLS